MLNLIFTIHFATINTSAPFISSIGSELFTIHFATINTLSKSQDMSRPWQIYNTLCYY